MIKRYFANGWIAALETLRNDIEVAVKNGDIYRAEDVYDMIDGYIDVASSRLTPLQADAARPGEAEQLALDAAQLKHGR